MAVTSCYGTLSKSDRKPKNSKAKIAKTAERSAPAVLEVDPNEVTVSSILVEHAQLDIGEKKFNRPTLGYVTPWNSHGYNIAKWAAKKFTHISPVWFQLKPANIDGQKTCSIGGTHDIDQRWMADVRSNNSDVSFVPRFLMEDWTSGTVDDFLYDEIWQRRCAQAMVDLIEVFVDLNLCNERYIIFENSLPQILSELNFNTALGLLQLSYALERCSCPVEIFRILCFTEK
ncbi:unnamed protein product [Toxocara canis]|uniref:Phospholipase-like protein n=1 Tax=Toxocara canis TaxID=6265 RepID=A0A183TY19_TOXCA|nr:unnamed protein product [Toxocara canis]